MERLHAKVKRLQIAVTALIVLNLFIFISAYRQKDSSIKQFDEISVDRINIVDKKGVTKMVIASQDMLRKDAKGINTDDFNYSGMLFRNEEGEECGGLIYNGKRTVNGQEADAGLTFDQYNQDQVININHSESVDSSGSAINDGITIIQRPDYTKTNEEYKIYADVDRMKLTKEQKDSVRGYYADQGVVSRRRLFLGVDRGFKNNIPYNETGLFIKNKMGNVIMKMFVDYNNVPHFEVYEKNGKKRIYDLNFQNKSK